MQYIFLFAMPLVIVALIMTPLIYNLRHRGEKSRKRAIIGNLVSFFGVMVLMTVIPLTGAFAASAPSELSAQGFAEGMKYIGAALSTGLGTIGTGVAVGGAAPAAIGAVSENDKSFTKALIFVALGEGVAIYGLLISILILFG